jgi:hypothetical protein
MNLYFYAVYPPVRILGVTAGLNLVKAKLNNDVIMYFLYWVQYVKLGVLPISMRPGECSRCND